MIDIWFYNFKESASEKFHEDSLDSASLLEGQNTLLCLVTRKFFMGLFISAEKIFADLLKFK